MKCLKGGILWTESEVECVLHCRLKGLGSIFKGLKCMCSYGGECDEHDGVYGDRTMFQGTELMFLSYILLEYSFSRRKLGLIGDSYRQNHSKSFDF